MPALMIPTFIENAGALPMATLTNVSQVKEYELAASEHWIFNKAGASNLVGIKNGGALTVVGSAPTHNAASLTLSATIGNQLASAFSDQLTYTWCGVVKVPAQNQGSGVGQTIFSTNGGNANGGATLSIQGGTAVDLNSRAVIAGATVSNNINIADATVGIYQFYSFVMDHAGATKVRRAASALIETTITDTGAFTPHPTLKLSLGASANDFGNGAEICEAILFAGQALTATQLGQVYLRSKARLLRQSGITVA